ncbi:MAG: hypothetical protein ACP5XB_24995 [Isosphaeraceae bacterium]
MCIIVYAAIVCSLAAQQDGQIGPDHLDRILRGLHDKIQDVSLICEGTEETLQPELLDRQRTVRRRGFQCSYDYRSDSSARLDLYTYGDTADSLFQRQVRALLGRDLERYDAFPDQVRIASVTSAIGSPYSFNVLGSPSALVYMWYFRFNSGKFASMNYENLGWEAIDGHRCLKVRMDFLPNMPANRRAYREYWIDLERGGHPLRIDNYHGNLMGIRTSGIELCEFKGKGRERIWLPVDGVRDTFVWKTAKRGLVRSEKAISRVTYHVVKSTVRFNQGLSDGYFRLRKKGEPLSARRPFDLSRKFDKEAKKPPAVRSDPESVRERLDAKLAEAEKQAATLTASSRGRTVWEPQVVVQATIAVAGAGLLFGAWLVWRRGRL